MVRNVEQRPVLFALVRELLEHERLVEFADSLPTRARVSEPALPLLVSALHEQLGRALTILVPEDADARDLAEAAAWYLGPERVALLPSRGVRWDSGLQILLLLFASVTLGGLGTAFGALVGSLIIGLVVELAPVAGAPGDLKYASALVILILLLMVRPQGILGRAERVG